MKSKKKLKCNINRKLTKSKLLGGMNRLNDPFIIPTTDEVERLQPMIDEVENIVLPPFNLQEIPAATPAPASAPQQQVATEPFNAFDNIQNMLDLLESEHVLASSSAPAKKSLPKYEPNKCPHCGRSFSRPFRVEKHIEAVHAPGKQGYNCPKCTFVFTLPRELDYHLKSNHPDIAVPKSLPNYELNKCPHCGRSFSWPVVLMRHIEAVHTSGKQGYKCPKCTFVFTRTQELDYHLKSNHPDTAPVHIQLPQLEEEEVAMGVDNLDIPPFYPAQAETSVPASAQKSRRKLTHTRQSREPFQKFAPDEPRKKCSKGTLCPVKYFKKGMKTCNYHRAMEKRLRRAKQVRNAEKSE